MQTDLLENVAEELKLRVSYFLLLVTSTIIATLGLIINSSAVVIGAMLIAPLFWPVLGLTISVITTRRKLASKSAILSIISLVAVILISFVATLLIPVQEIGTEILSRTSPTTLDLVIALAASVIGVAAMYYPRISSTATGVAISLALLPPLCVVGIGLGVGDYTIARGAMLLFVTNMLAIIVAGAITLYFMKFKPKRETDKKRLKYGLGLSLFLLAILIVPLSIFFEQSVEKNIIEDIVRKTLVAELGSISGEVRLEDLKIDYLPSIDSQNVNIEGTVFLPSGEFVTTQKQDELISNLENMTKKTVSLNLDLVNTVQFRSNQDIENREIRESITEIVNQVIDDSPQEILIENINIDILREESFVSATVNIRLREFDINGLRINLQKEIQNQTLEDLDIESNVIIELIPVIGLGDIDLLDRISNVTKSELQNILISFNPSITILSFDIKEMENQIQNTYNVNSVILVPSDFEYDENFKSIIEQNLRNSTNYDLNLDIKIVREEVLEEG